MLNKILSENDSNDINDNQEYFKRKEAMDYERERQVLRNYFNNNFAFLLRNMAKLKEALEDTELTENRNLRGFEALGR
jgi:hypothetical protein